MNPSILQSLSLCHLINVATSVESIFICHYREEQKTRITDFFLEVEIFLMNFKRLNIVANGILRVPVLDHEMKMERIWKNN